MALLSAMALAAVAAVQRGTRVTAEMVGRIPLHGRTALVVVELEVVMDSLLTPIQREEDAVVAELAHLGRVPTGLLRGKEAVAAPTQRLCLSPIGWEVLEVSLAAVVAVVHVPATEAPAA